MRELHRRIDRLEDAARERHGDNAADAVAELKARLSEIADRLAGSLVPLPEPDPEAVQALLRDRGHGSER